MTLTIIAPALIAATGFACWLWVAASKRARTFARAAPVAALATAQTDPAAAAKLQVESLYNVGLSALRNNQFGPAAASLTLAAQRGHPRAQLHFGVLCEHGIGVPVDLERARQLYALAASQGDVDAHFRLQVLDTIATLGDKATGRRRLKAISAPL